MSRRKSKIDGIDRWGFPLSESALRAREKYLRKLEAAQRLPGHGPGSARYERMLVGLRALCARQGVGQTFSHREIARETGVSHMLVKLVERRALRKMRSRFTPEMCDALAGLTAKHRETATAT